MSAYATQLSELDHHNLLQEALRQRDRAEAAERRADALERALQSACERMDRVRTILQDSCRSKGWHEDTIKKYANWGALDTSDLRAALTDQPTTPRDRLAGILSDMGASPERAGELLAEIERRVADQPTQSGSPGESRLARCANTLLQQLPHQDHFDDNVQRAITALAEAVASYQDQPAQDGGSPTEDDLKRLMGSPKYWRDRDPDTVRKVQETGAKLFSQDGGRLDPYTKKRAMEVAEEVRRRNLPYKKRSSLAHGAVVAASAIRQAIYDLQPDQPADAGEAFQARVWPWLIHCFGEEIARDGRERNHRFLEEALELVQSTGCTASEAHQLVDYVFGRPVGEPHQETGGVMVTLAALCLAHGLDMHAAGEDELTRVWGKADEIRAKQAAKPANGPLPGPTEPADAGEPFCGAGPREEERERCARQLEATAARLEQRAATAPTVALRTGLNADARMCRMNAAAIRRTGDTGGGDE
jgi:hypothetical protein